MGLEGLTLGGLADALDLSKAGVVGPFGSRQELQAAALTAASKLFIDAVITPSMTVTSGLQRLIRIIDQWSGYLVDCPFPNGCFFTAASHELDDRPGKLRDALQSTINQWNRFLREEVRRAKAVGDLDPGVDADDVVHVLTGLVMAANQAIQLLHENPGLVQARTRRLMRSAIGVV